MRKFIISSCLALSCVSVAAQASMVSLDSESAVTATAIQSGLELAQNETIYEDVRMMSGTDGNVSRIGKVAAGEYELTLTDFVFPVMFDELKVALTTATNIVSIISLESGITSWSEVVELAANESYYLSVFGTTASPSSYGLYGIKLAQYSPVPLPASALLLLSGLFAWGVSSAKRKRAL